MFKQGEIKPIRKQFTIEEKDLRPSIEQTPYMQRNGIPDQFNTDMNCKQIHVDNSVYNLYNSGYFSPDECFQQTLNHHNNKAIHQRNLISWWSRKRDSSENTLSINVPETIGLINLYRNNRKKIFDY